MRYAEFTSETERKEKLRHDLQSVIQQFPEDGSHLGDPDLIVSALFDELLRALRAVSHKPNRAG
jgi:hypothetical protein